MRKTYKREFVVAGVWLPFMALVSVTTYNSNTADLLELVRILWIPVAALIAGAFGMDAVAKQLRGGQNPPPEDGPSNGNF